MKLKSLTILLLLTFLLLIPMSYAQQEGLENTTFEIEESPLEEIDIEQSITEVNNSVNDDESEVLSENISYFTQNSENIEEPMLDDNFATPSIKFTEKNTFYVNASYDGSNELGTQNNPFKTLNSAFAGLILNRSVVNIYVASGDYEITKTISFTKNLNIIGQNPLNTVLCAKNSREIFLINKNNLAVNIINLTFTAGNNYYGGAIYNNRSSVKLINTIFKDNVAEGYSTYSGNYSAAGGALYNEAGTYKIYNSTFINNAAKSSLNMYGAAIYNDLGILSILNSKFINNTLYDGDYGCGGAVYNFNGFLTVYNSTFENNTVVSNYSAGGAIYNYEAHNVYVINSSFDGNKLYGKYAIGSAIASSASLLEIVNSTISNNLAKGIAPFNSTVYNSNGVYNFINSTTFNNTVQNPDNLILMCLEDQFIISQAFEDDLLTVLPSKYDLRDENLVTSVKNQGSSGACWAFTTISALESFLLKYENLSYDFSENNLKNLMNYRGENGTDWADGGNYQMALAYFIRWDGPVDEDDDYFSAYSTIPHYDLNRLKHVQGAMFLPIRMGYLDNDQIKYAIMKYGALYTSIYATSMTKNVYNSVAEIPNHAVAIVGWDDDYPANKFSGDKPPGNGAFIIKNSWGTSYGDKGFGYVSYYDKTFAGFSLDSLSAMAFTDVENITNYKDIYQYDILGNTFESLGYSSNTAWLANQFEAKSNNPLSAFGLYTYGASEYLVDIYVNGQLKHSQEGSVSYAGYHTIKLNNLVNLSVGDIFRLNVKLTTFDSMFPVAIESNRNGYSSKATASLNQSFISPDGINWFDIAQDFEIVKISGCLYNKTLTGANVCLKAYTANVADLQLKIISNSSYYYKNDEINVVLNLTNYGDYAENINITLFLDDAINILGVDYTGGIFNEHVLHIKSLNHNEFVILNLTLKMPEIKNHTESIAKVNMDVYTFNFTYAGFTEFLFKNITSLSKSCEIINVTLLDLLSNPICDADIKVNFNSQNLTLRSDENGIVQIKLDLLEGNYSCNLYFSGDDVYYSNYQSFNIQIIKRLSNISNTNANTFYCGDGPELRLLDENSISMINKTLKIIHSGKELKYNTDENGIVFLSDLKSGNYEITCLFEGDDLFYSSQIRFNVSIVKINTLLSSKALTATVVVKTDGKIGPYLKVTLKDINSKALANKKILIKLNSHIYNLFTNKMGVASLQINIVKSGTYKARISFSGDDIYLESSSVSKIIIKKKKTSLKVPKKTYKSSKKVKLTATLKVYNGKVIKYKKIFFKVNGRKYVGITNKKGMASVKVKLTKKKTYRVTVIFKGDSSYSKIVKKSKLRIK